MFWPIMSLFLHCFVCVLNNCLTVNRCLVYVCSTTYPLVRTLRHNHHTQLMLPMPAVTQMLLLLCQLQIHVRC